MLLMVLVAGYLVTIEPSFLSSPNPQPTPFFTSPAPPAWFTLAVFPAFFVFIPLLLIETFSFSPPCFLSCFPSFLSILLIFLCFSLFLHSLLFSPPPTTPLPLFCPLPLCFWASGQYQGVFLILFLSVPRLPPSLSPVSSHFHAARRVAMLCFFIAVCGRGGGLLPATNGLLENTDSHASQSGEPGREGERIWREA